MEFIHFQKIKDDEKAMKEALSLMSQLSEEIKSDGLSISTNELYSIATASLSLTKVYESEARNRNKKDPVYVQNESLRLASIAANRHQLLVNELRKYTAILARLDPKLFVMDSDSLEMRFTGSLEDEIKKVHTQYLSKKQELLVKGVEAFQKALSVFNNLLIEAGQRKIDIQLPFLNYKGEPDLQQIINIDYESIESRKKAAIEQSIKEKEIREKQRKRLESLIPKDYPNRAEEIQRYLAIDPDGSKYNDEIMKNLISPSKGSFVTNRSRVKSVGYVSDGMRLPGTDI
jgi:hypothetical protein